MTPPSRALGVLLFAVGCGLGSGREAAPWHTRLALDGGGWWRARVQVVISNDQERPAQGDPVAVPIGSQPGQADLVGQRAESLRVCTAEGVELLFALQSADGTLMARGPVPSGSILIVPAEAGPCQQVVYYVYFDNPLAWEPPDVLSAQLGVLNGDMEQGHGLAPPGWVHDAPDEQHRASWVAERPHSGKRCLKTVVAAGAQPTWIATRQDGIRILGGARYRMSAWVRAENVQGWAGWYIHVGNAQNSMQLSPMLSGGGGTYEWKEVTAEFTAPAHADRADVGTVLRGTGTAWFDDVRLELLDSPRLRASAGQVERLALTEVGDPTWPQPLGGALRRAAVRYAYLGDRPTGLTLLAVDASPLLARRDGGQQTALAVFDGASPVDFRQVGNLLLVPADLPPRTVRTWYAYQLPSAGEKTASTQVGTPISGAGQHGVYALGIPHNRVENPGFEAGERLPAGWKHDAAGAGVAYAVEDPSHPALGRRCARMTVGPEAPPAWRGWHQSVPVQPGKTYLVAAWMKCRDVAGEVRVHLHRYTAQGKHSQREPMTSIGPGLRGTRDWALQWGLVAMPADTVRLDLHLTMNTRGTVWHDEVVVAEVLPARLAATEGRPLPATGVALWQVPAVVKVFEDDVPPEDAAPLALAAARNEQEPLQLAIRSGRSMGQVRVEVEPPSGPQGRKLPVTTEIVGYVPIDHPTNYYRAESPAWHRKAPTSAGACDGWPGRWPDPLLPRNTFDLKANRTQPVWITVDIPRDAPAGLYTGQVRLLADGKTLLQRPWTVEVWDFTLPEATHLGAIYDVRITGRQADWNMPADEAEREIVRFMARRRLCPDCVRPFPVLKYENGRVTADFAAFDRAAQWYFDELKVPYSYTPWYFYLFGWGLPPRKAFGQDPYPGIWPYEGADRSQLRPEFKKAYQACLRTFWDHLKQKGWDKRFVLYISDEPFDSQPPIRQQMKALCRMIHEVDPALPIYSSTWKHVPDWDGFITVWGIGHYGNVSPEQMTRIRQGGARIWFTTDGQMCTDTPYCAVERLLPHYCFHYGAEAYEFWGISWYTYDPFRFGWHAYIPQTDQPGKSYWVRYPNGDGFLLYPGGLVGHRGPISSIRLEQARDGVEDYEYLYMLRQRIERAKAAGADVSRATEALRRAAELVSIPNAGGRYSTRILPEPRRVEEVRRALAQAIVALGP